MSSSILWFRQDLRLHDNEALLEALRNGDEIIPIYVFDVKPKRTSVLRLQFLIECVADLRRQLRALGSELIIRVGKPDAIIYQLALDSKSQWVYCNRERTREEVDVQDRLEQNLWTIGRELRYTRGKMLFYTADLPFPITHCPDAYINFKKEVESLIPVRLPLEVPDTIPGFTIEIDAGRIPEVLDFLPGNGKYIKTGFEGGETKGLEILKNLDQPKNPASTFSDGTILSPWISMGCLSPKKVYHTSFNLQSGGEEIRQHLLYRDYLRLMGKKYGDRIFYPSGTKGIKPLYRADNESFKMWSSGNTGVAIIDAAMHHLNREGWIPDVMRKTVASYLIKVLKLDWRLGAAYFESTLIDYDPCSNWVSWLNLAGVGPDSRDDRVIHYDLIGKKLDPDGSYIRMWNS
jgi:deoxyribodipyrimidine photo-lyase